MFQTSKPRFRTVLSRSTLALVLSLGCALLVAGEASAAIPSSFGAAGSGGGEFRQPRGIAASVAGEEVLVVDQNNARLDAFNTGGSFLRAFGWGVASAKEELQTCTTRCFAGFEGSGAGEFSSPEGVAVDNHSSSLSYGDVYVGDLHNHRIQKFTASGEFLLMFGGEVNATTKANVCLAGESCQAGVEGAGPGQFQFTSGNPFAVDATGTVYVGDVNRVQEFNELGEVQGEVKLPGAGSIQQLAVDSAKDLYVKSSELAGVRKYDLLGKKEGAPRDEAGFPGPLAVGVGDELFVADGFGHILGYDAEGNQEQSFGAGVDGSAGIAYDQAENAIYALSNTAVNVIPVPPAGPLVVSESAEAIAPKSATLSATINPEGPKATEYHFEYGTTPTYGENTATTPLTGGEFEDIPVSAPITGLQPATTYHYRVVAENGTQTTDGPDETFSTLSSVSIDKESVSAVTAFSARLEGELNPNGSPTEYHFEYGTSTAYSESAPAPDQSAGEGTEDTSVAVPIQNLTAGTTYHYRLVAHNGFGTSLGADQTFTTQSSTSTALIDGRAWEMVSPPDKQGVTFEAINEVGADIQAAEDGHAITYAATAPLTKEAAGNRELAMSQVLSTRQSPGAWASKDIATKHEEVAGSNLEASEYQIFSPDLSTGIVEPAGGTPLSEAATERTPYRREADGSYTPLVTAANVSAGVKFGGKKGAAGAFFYGVSFITTTPDQASVLLSSPQPLTPGVTFVENEVTNIYRWTAGSLDLMSVLPNGAPTSTEGDQVTVPLDNFAMRNALSQNGDRAIFETTHNGASHHLYLRDEALGQTVQLDAPEPGLKAPGGAPVFQLASSDGSRVFFTDDGRLTADATESSDLYECEMKVSAGHLKCALTDLTVDSHPGEAAKVLGLLPGADDTGRFVYFVADGRLAAGAVRGDCEEELNPALSCNLYVRDTVTATTRLVAVLSASDLRAWAFHQANLGFLATRVSPDGQYLAFMSERPLTGFDNRDAKSGVRDQEVFEYSLGANTLTCVSCASSGARPRGVFDSATFPGLLVDRRGLWGGRWLAASLPGWTSVNNSHALYQSRYLSDSGRMFFNSATPLVPGDANGLEDVYEYEPAGVGGCDLSSGCQGLISSGGSSEEAAFMDASADGSDVFFLSSAQLSKSDTDNAYDIYDAHVCSESAPCAGEAATAPPPCGTADACRAAPSPQPDIFGSPASQTFSGSGNAAPAASKVVVKSLTRAQKLTKALAACKRVKGKTKRAACIKRARKAYGPVKNKKKPAKKRG